MCGRWLPCAWVQVPAAAVAEQFGLSWRMRRWLICLLVGLLSFQAGAGLSIGHGQPSDAKAPIAANSDAAPCHAALDEDLPAAPGHHFAVSHDLGGVAVCDGCQSCDLCHPTLSLFLTVAPQLAAAHHGLPQAQPALLGGRHWPPPLEPPRL